MHKETPGCGRNLFFYLLSIASPPCPSPCPLKVYYYSLSKLSCPLCIGFCGTIYQRPLRLLLQAKHSEKMFQDWSIRVSHCAGHIGQSIRILHWVLQINPRKRSSLFYPEVIKVQEYNSKADQPLWFQQQKDTYQVQEKMRPIIKRRGVGKQRQEMKRKESECVHGGM